MSGEARRSLGFWRSWSLVVGGTIGSAIFMMPAVMAPYGGIGLLSLAVATLGALSIAIMFGNLARRVTVTGGAYAYTRAGLGDFAGFLIAWGGWIGLWVSCTAIAIAFAAYLGAVVPVIGASPVLTAVAGLSLIWIVVGVNVAGVRESGIVSLVTTILKLLPLVLIGCIGLLFVETETLPAMHPGEGNAVIVFASVFALTFWNFLGIESATVPAEDTLNSGNTISRATLIGTLTVGMVYLLVNFVALGVLPTEELAASTSPLSDVGIRLVGGIGGVIVVVGALVSTAGCINTTLLAAGQMAMAAARDGLFPGLFARISARHAPSASYVLSGMLASLLLLLNFAKGLVAAYTFILLIATLTTVIPYAFSAISGLILQGRDPSISRSHRLREGGVAAIAFGVCMWVIAASGFETVYWGFLLLMAGLPVYVMVTRVKPAEDHRPD